MQTQVQSQNKTHILITQVNSYIGTQVCLHFLTHGDFKVRGTVRSTKNAAKLETLKSILGDLYEQLEIVEADVKDEDTVRRASEGCDYVINT